MRVPVGPWLIEDAEGNELARGGAWGASGAPIKIIPYRGGCGAPKPHFDGDGQRDGFSPCRRMVEVTLAGTQTGRCRECRLREQEQRVLNVEVPDGSMRRQSYRRAGG